MENLKNDIYNNVNGEKKIMGKMRRFIAFLNKNWWHKPALLGVILILISPLYFYLENYDYSKAKVIYESEQKAVIKNSEEFVIYYADTNNTLIKKRIEVDQEQLVSDKYKAIFESIISSNKNVYKFKKEDGKEVLSLTLDEIGLELLDAYLNDDVLYLNITLSDKGSFVEKKEELGVIYSIVNSFTGLENIKKVKFLLNNQPVKKIGSINLINFLGKDSNI